MVLNSQEDQLVSLAALELVNSPNAVTDIESYIKIFDDYSESQISTEGCNSNVCSVSIESNLKIIIHRHVGDTDDLKMIRQFPGHGDHSMVENGVINAIVTPSNAVRVIERVNGEMRARTILSKNKIVTSTVDGKWKMKQKGSKQLKIINRRRKTRKAFRSQL